MRQDDGVWGRYLNRRAVRRNLVAFLSTSELPDEFKVVWFCSWFLGLCRRLKDLDWELTRLHSGFIIGH